MEWGKTGSKEASRKRRGHCSNAGESGRALGCMEVQGLKRMVDHREALRSRRLGYRNEGEEEPRVCSVACLRHTQIWDY